MEIFRSIAAIILGYIILSFSNMAFVIAFFIQKWFETGILIAVLTVLYTALTSAIGGYLLAMIAGRKQQLHGIIVACMVGAVIVFSMIIDVAVEPLWYKIIYLIVMVPATIVGTRLKSS